MEKYASYIDLFDKEIFPFDDSIEECLQNIFKDIDIRTQEQIIKKVMLTHKLLYIDKKDYSFMCMELILTVMLFIYNEDATFLEETTVDMDNLESIFSLSNGINKPTFSIFFKEKFEQISFGRRHSFSDEPLCYILPSKASLYGAVIFTWYWMHGKNENAIIQHTKGDSYEVISENYEELKKFVETINMMR